MHKILKFLYKAIRTQCSFLYQAQPYESLTCNSTTAQYLIEDTADKNTACVSSAIQQDISFANHWNYSSKSAQKLILSSFCKYENVFSLMTNIATRVSQFGIRQCRPQQAYPEGKRRMANNLQQFQILLFTSNNEGGCRVQDSNLKGLDAPIA